MPSASWGAPCEGTIKTLVRSDGLRLPIRLEILELVALLIDETERRGYDVKPGQTWGNSCRKIRNSSSWSNHAWGLAIDINAPSNPMTNRLITDMSSWMPALWKSYGFRWGGDYRGRKDAMHYEFLGSVADAKAQTERARRELKGGAKPVIFRLTAGQIKWLAESVDIPAGELTLATAIGLAESNGNPRAYNGKGLDASYGIWQINTHGKLGSDRRAKLGLKSNDELFDPAQNARAMKLVWDEANRSWGPWGAFTDGRYKKYLNEARQAVSTPIPNVNIENEEEVEMLIFGTTSDDMTKAGVWLLAGDGRAHHVPNPDDLTRLVQKGQIRDLGGMSVDFLLRFERVHPLLEGSMP